METLASTLQRELDVRGSGPISLGRLLAALGPRGPAALMVVLPLPFCLPVQIPGLSIPFGLILLLVGAQLGWRKQLWCPQWLANRTISHEALQSIVEWVTKAETLLTRWLRPRWKEFTESQWIHRLLGIVVILLASVLCVPIPLPFSNMFVSIPMVVLGLALLAQDGVALVGGFLLAALGLMGLVALGMLAIQEFSKAALLIAFLAVVA